DVLLLLALAYAAAGDDARAANAFEKVLSLDPGEIRAAYALARARNRLGEPDAALEALRAFHLRHLAIDGPAGDAPAAPFVHPGLLREVAGVAPVFPLATYADGFHARSQGDYEEAVEAFRRAARHDPLVTGTPPAAAARIA